MLQLSNFEPSPANVKSIIDKFKQNQLNRLNKLWDYYDGKNIIKDRTMQTGKPNNRLVHEYCKYVTDTVSGYFLGINVKYTSSDEEYLKAFISIVEDNFEEDENLELAKQASIFGYGVEILYQNEISKTRFKRVDPRSTILIFGTSINSFLLGAIRFYKETGLDNKETEIAVVYTKEEIITYKKTDEVYEEINREIHYFKEVPVIVYKNNEEMKSDFEGIIDLVDAYDKSQSDSSNDFEYFTDAYLIISGHAGGLDDQDEDEDKAYRNMRQRRVMFLGEKGAAQFLTKTINDTATENYKDRLNSDIHKFSMTPDLSDEKFAGNLSGISIEFKILPLEQRTKMKENKFRTALKKRREIITNILNAKEGTSYDYREIKEEFKRNVPRNTKELTETIMQFADRISDKTLFELLPQIKDADEEIRRLQEERKTDDNNQYNVFEVEEEENE